MDLKKLTSLISSLRAETANAAITPESLGALLQKIVDTLISTSGGGINISCDTKGKVLYVKGAAALAEAGYVPCIFKYSVKSSHLTNYHNGLRYHGPTRRGWHIMFNSSFAKVEANDAISFKTRKGGMLQTEFTCSPTALVSIREGRTQNGVLQYVKVGFGKRTFDAKKGKRFQYGIGFIRQDASNNFSPKNLVTNIAPFKIYVTGQNTEQKAEVSFSV